MADSPKFPKFSWSKAKREASQLVALDELTVDEIAQKCGADRKTLYNWRKHPEFKAEVERLVTELGAVAERYALGKRSRRLRYLSDRHARLHEVIRERAADPSMQEIAGGKTGLLVRQTKALRSDDGFEIVHEYAVDTGTLRELRETEKQAAQEAGQWAEKKELSGPGGGAILVQIVEVVKPDAGTDRDDA